MAAPSSAIAHGNFAMQTDLAERLGKTHGLQHDIEDPFAQHEHVKRVNAKMLARTTQALNRKVAELSEQAKCPGPSRKQEPKGLGSKALIQERRVAPVEEVRADESITSEHRIRP